MHISDLGSSQRVISEEIFNIKLNHESLGLPSGLSGCIHADFCLCLLVLVHLE